ncbi:MAG: hypothetical protein PHT27_08230 [Candidatus Izemoplasmatales bacterium]|nr:hypothetical protein [Candidatus Izemoplasmatales bacterium]
MNEKKEFVYDDEEMSKEAALLSLQMAFSMDIKEMKGLLYELLRKRLVGREIRTIRYI